MKIHLLLFYLLFSIRWAGASEAPNVLFIIVDDLRPEMGCYGAETVKTPHLDRFAGTGLVFDRAYCQQAICMSSRHSLLTGLRPSERRIWTNRNVEKDLQDIDFFPGHFRKNGYWSAGIGKINHNSWEDPRCWSVPHMMPANSAFEYRTRAGRALVEQLQEEAARAGKPDPFVNIPEKIRRGMPWESLAVEDDELGDGQIADLAIQALKDQSQQEEPFLLAVGFLRPHLPFVAPQRYWEMYEAKDLPLAAQKTMPQGMDPTFGSGSGELFRQYRGLPDRPPLDEAQARQLVHGYFACVSYIDAQVGRILGALEELGFDDDTVVIFTSDHGFQLGDHGMWGKATNFELATRVPLIVRTPGQAKNAGRRVSTFVELVDLYPTLCDLAGLPTPDHVRGKSFAPVLSDPAATHRESAISQFARMGAMGYSIRTDEFRYTEWQNRESGEVVSRELYDHREHSRESKNVVSDAGFSPDVEELSKALRNRFELD